MRLPGQRARTDTDFPREIHPKRGRLFLCELQVAFQPVRDASERWGVGDLLAEGHALVQALTNGLLDPGAEGMDDGIVQGGGLRVVCYVTTVDAGEPGEGIVDGVRAEERPTLGMRSWRRALGQTLDSMRLWAGSRPVTTTPGQENDRGSARRAGLAARVFCAQCRPPRWTPTHSGLHRMREMCMVLRLPLVATVITSAVSAPRPVPATAMACFLLRRVACTGREPRALGLDHDFRIRDLGFKFDLLSLVSLFLLFVREAYSVFSPPSIMHSFPERSCLTYTSIEGHFSFPPIH